MKKQIATVLLACYALALFRPLAPCIADLLAHTFWHSEHVATVHFEDGKYHVHVELKKAAEASENSAPADASKKGAEESIGSHLLSENELRIPSPALPSQDPTGDLRLPSSADLSLSPPPPWRS